MLNLNSVMIGTQQSQALVAFYEKVLGKPADMADSEQGFWGWQVGSVFFSVLEHSEIVGNAKDPGRVLINFETAQIQEEFARIKASGAVVVREPYEMSGGWIATLADPDGNYFQLITPIMGQ
jgi:predicted enzyme related to lactoylglutathione lyase